VGTIEIICGTLILIGLMTRVAAMFLIIDMLVAISTTKIPILLGHGFWRFGVSKLPSYGFWAMAHEARVDFTMLLGSIFLMIVGAGTWSIDQKMLSRWNQPQKAQETQEEEPLPLCLLRFLCGRSY
jgi:putative oxidoreductase